jgi:GT2 family glycosyltransferase
VATLNDDAEAEPEWLSEMVAALQRNPRAGMCAARVHMADQPKLDSAGMLICGDGSSKQRGHLAPPEEFCRETEVLFPSGSAALYRRAMLDEAGLFDEEFFLYCEDSDLGLRARWAGWTCIYTPRAVVWHHYSHSSGRASAVKAYHVERNRLFVLVKNFPARLLFSAPFVTAARYGWHLFFLLGNRGAAAGFRDEGNATLRLAWFVLRAHAALLGRLPRLWRQRRRIRKTARLSAAEFSRLVQQHYITAREVAAL